MSRASRRRRVLRDRFQDGALAVPGAAVTVEQRVRQRGRARRIAGCQTAEQWLGILPVESRKCHEVVVIDHRAVLVVDVFHGRDELIAKIAVMAQPLADALVPVAVARRRRGLPERRPSRLRRLGGVRQDLDGLRKNVGLVRQPLHDALANRGRDELRPRHGQRREEVNRLVARELLRRARGVPLPRRRSGRKRRKRKQPLDERIGRSGEEDDTESGGEHAD